MTRKMIVNAADPEEVRIAILNAARLEDFDIETRGVEKNKGNIYKATVVDVEPSLNAAFIDYGAEKQGFLTAGDVDPVLAKKPLPKGRSPSISDLLSPKQEILVQVTKDEVGAKGAVLTTYLSLAGRYVVLQPDSDTQGVSRKVDDEDTRRSMRETIAKLDVPEGMGVIVRTAGRDRTKTELMRDLKVLLRLWDKIQKTSDESKSPSLIFKEQDVIIRALRDYFQPDIDEVVLDSDEAFDRAAEYMTMVMPKHRGVLTRYVERRPIFHHYRIEEQLEALYSPRVPLDSGGSLVVEPTEALVSIDVNSGKQKHGSHEETATKTNIEAAKEIARQLRLRDLGGIIVIDFIDMMQRRNQQKVEKALREALRNDKARIKVSRISRNGTLELTRQRIRSALAQSVFRTCHLCHGTGRILNPQSHAVSVLRKVRDRCARGDLKSVTVRLEAEAANHLRTAKWSEVQDLEQHYGVQVDVTIDHAMSPGQEDFTFETDPEAILNELSEPNFGPAPLPDGYVPPPPEDDDEEEDDELEEMSAEEALAGGGSGRKRRRKRKGTKSASGERRSAKSKDKDGDALRLPSFELLDPEDVGLGDGEKKSGGRRKRRRASGSGESAQDGNGTGERKRRRRRGSRGRKRRKDGDTGAAASGDKANGESAASKRPARGGKKPAAAKADQAPKPAAAAAAAADGQKKPGLFARLFGLK